MSLKYAKPKIQFFYPGGQINLSNRIRLKFFIHSIFKKEHKKLKSLNCIFCTDDKLLQINRQHLDHDFYTDIITFNLSETLFIQGEIYISIDRIKENARIYGISFKNELHRVIFHGVLHLCGYKDKSKVEKLKMSDKEDYYLKKYLI